MHSASGLSSGGRRYLPYHPSFPEPSEAEEDSPADDPLDAEPLELLLGFSTLLVFVEEFEDLLGFEAEDESE